MLMRFCRSACLLILFMVYRPNIVCGQCASVRDQWSGYHVDNSGFGSTTASRDKKTLSLKAANLEQVGSLMQIDGGHRDCTINGVDYCTETFDEMSPTEGWKVTKNSQIQQGTQLTTIFEDSRWVGYWKSFLLSDCPKSFGEQQILTRGFTFEPETEATRLLKKSLDFKEWTLDGNLATAQFPGTLPKSAGFATDLPGFAVAPLILGAPAAKVITEKMEFQTHCRQVIPR